jgi:uncharacterized membrane protein
VYAELIVLRVVHLLGGIIWVGSAVFTFFFLVPAISQSGPAGGQVMANLQKRRLFTVLPVVAVLTMLSGLRLMMILSNSFAGSYFRSPMGRAYAISGSLAILAFVIGVAVSRPGAMKMTKLQQSAVSDQSSKELIQAEIKALQSRVAMSGIVVVVLLILAAAGMALARYV